MRYSTFSFWLEIPSGLKFWGVLGILHPLVHAHINEDPVGHLLASNRVVLAIMHVCAALSSTATRSREKHIKEG
jgi:hypothetical protein